MRSGVSKVQIDGFRVVRIMVSGYQHVSVDV